MIPTSFWLYLVSRFASATAMMMLRAAVAWHVYALSHSAFHLGLIGLVQFAPALALTLVGGVLADRHDRRRIMMWAQVVPLASALTLFVATRSGAATLPLLYGLIFLVAVAGAFESPSRMALMPTLVAREVFPRAVTIAATNQALAFASGPAACGWVIAAANVGAVYAVDAALVATSLLTLAFLPSSGHPAERRTPGLLAVREGLAFVRGNQVVLGCMTLDLLAVIFGGAGALLPIYATEILQVGPKGYGMLSSSFEAGALVMSLLLTTLPPITRSGRALLGTVAIYGLATVVFGVSRWFPLSVLAYVAVGMADQVSVVLRSTTIQLSTPDALRGRVSGVNMLFISASNQVGAAESGFVAALTSATFSVVSGGIACLAVVVIVAMRMPALRRYRIDRAQAA